MSKSFDPKELADVKDTLLLLVEASRTFHEEVAAKLKEFDKRLVATEILIEMLFTYDENDEDEEDETSPRPS